MPTETPMSPWGDSVFFHDVEGPSIPIRFVSSTHDIQAGFKKEPKYTMNASTFFSTNYVRVQGKKQKAHISKFVYILLARPVRVGRGETPFKIEGKSLHTHTHFPHYFCCSNRYISSSYIECRFESTKPAIWWYPFSSHFRWEDLLLKEAVLRALNVHILFLFPSFVDPTIEREMNRCALDGSRGQIFLFLERTEEKGKATAINAIY